MMVTYEDFIRKNGIENLTSLEIGRNTVSSYMRRNMGAITDNPEEYLDIPRKAPNLRVICIDPIQTQEYSNSIREFIKECRDDVSISCLGMGGASKEEFFAGESIIDSIISQIDESWSVKQKVAFVHYKMGELVAYYPERALNEKMPFQKRYDLSNIRNIWKILSTGKGVCNGVTILQRTILARLGITTKELSSGTHSYMLTELEDGSNLITDATLDLANTLFECKPKFFGISYEDLIEIDGKDSRRHHLKEPPQNVTVVDNAELSIIYKSIGITREDGTFPAMLSRYLISLGNEQGISSFDKVRRFFDYIKENEPQKFTHIEECSAKFSWGIRCLGVKSKNCIAQYVYSKDDEVSQNPNLVLCVKGENQIPIVKIINPKSCTIDDISLEELDAQYNCHKMSKVEAFWKDMLVKDVGGIPEEERGID